MTTSEVHIALRTLAWQLGERRSASIHSFRRGCEGGVQRQGGFDILGISNEYNEDTRGNWDNVEVRWSWCCM